MPVTERDPIEMEKPEWLIQMETVLEVLNEGVLIADDSHRILFANSRFVEMTGILRQDLIGFDISRFYSAEEWDFLKQQFDVAFRDGHNRHASVLPRKGGGRLPVIRSSRVLQNSGRRFRIVTCTDISEEVRAREELRFANLKLRERQREIDDTVRSRVRIAKMSHRRQSLTFDEDLGL
jgi:PAS domain S-box-containing protein